MRVRVVMTNYLVLLSRFEEASLYFSDVPEDGTKDFPEAHILSLVQRAILAALRGEKDTAFELFERAVSATAAFSDGYLVTLVWDDYALWSLALGDLEVARTCRERALLAAHEQNISWRIAYLSLRYADLLVLTGEWDRAGDLVMNASRHNLDTPIIRLLLLGSGLPLGLELNDRRLIELSLDERLVDVAFQSGEDAHVASAVSALARYYISRERAVDAAALLKRGVRALRYADHCWAMLIDAGRYCGESDAAQAREILAARTRVPYHAVAQASLALFDAYQAERHNNQHSVRTLALSAAKQFAALGWLAYARCAEKLAGEKLSNTSPPADGVRRLGNIGSGLTAREHEVAELVLKGLTNRAIAAQLYITENTVESHMSSILTRVGVRSRWQLKEVFEE